MAIEEHYKNELTDASALWLGYAMPEDLAAQIFRLDTQPAIQTHKFGWSFIGALKNGFTRVALLSSCPIQNYPLGRRVFFGNGRFECAGIRGAMIPFINILGAKHVTRLISCVLTAIPIIRSERVKFVFIHGVHSPYLLFGAVMRFFRIRSIVVLTDPPGVILPTDGFLHRVLKKLDIYLVKWLVRQHAGVVALAPGLVEDLAPNSPSLIFPGILEKTFQMLPSGRRDDINPNDKIFTIVYAGGLDSRYGVDRLVEAVLGLEGDTRVRLKLFGRGDQESMIAEVAKRNNRIMYGGFVANKELISEFCAADLLVNPRPTTESFASLSFPSKLIEYLSTGCPVLTTKIKSIPKEMQSFFYFIDDESSNGIREALSKIMDMDRRIMLRRANEGRIYVNSELSQQAIGERIRIFANSLN